MDGVALGTVQRDPRTNAFDGRAIRRTFDEVPCCLCISSCVFRVFADLKTCAAPVAALHMWSDVAASYSPSWAGWCCPGCSPRGLFFPCSAALKSTWRLRRRS